MIICKAGSIKNQVAVNMFFICMSSKHIFIFSLQNRICDFGADLMGKFGIGEIIGMIGDDHVPGKVIPLFHDIIFPISAVMANSRSAVSGEQPNEETSFCSSVLSGFVM